MFAVVAVVDGGDGARRVLQGVVLAMLSQFLKALGTTYSSNVPYQVTFSTYFLTSDIRTYSHFIALIF